MKIRASEMEKIFGLSSNGVKLYERSGLIAPEHLEHNGYRVYDTSDLQSMGYVTQLRRLGFSMQETAALLTETDISQQMKSLERREQELEVEIEQLTRMRKSIRDRIQFAQMSNRLLDSCEEATTPSLYFLGMRQELDWIDEDVVRHSHDWISSYSPHTYSAILFEGNHFGSENANIPIEHSPTERNAFEKQHPQIWGDLPAQRMQYGIVVPGKYVLDIGLHLSRLITVILPRPSICTATRFQYDMPDFSEAANRIRSYVRERNLKIFGGGLALVTHCARADGSQTDIHLNKEGPNSKKDSSEKQVICTALLFVPLLNDDGVYGTVL